jgi:glutathione S-transferase
LNGGEVAVLQEIVDKQLTGLEKQFQGTGPFVWADSPSVADIVIFALVCSPFPGLIAAGADISKYPKVLACAEAVKNHPCMQKFKSQREYMQ